MKINRVTVGSVRACVTAGAVLAIAVAVTGSPARGQTPVPLAGNAAIQVNRNLQTETLMKIRAPLTVAAIGDIFAPQPFYSEDAGFQKLVGRMRQADVGFANMESSLVDLQHFDGPFAGVLAPLEMGKSMKAMGITMVNHANNQTFNGGVAGMVSTIDALDRLGIAHAGTGRNLQEARAAQYVATPKGRIGLIGMFSMDDWSNYGPNFAYSAATYRNGNLGGAPGLNPLRLTAYRVVSPAQMQTLKQLGGAVYGEANTPAAAASASTERFRFFNEWYQTGTDSGALHYEMNAGDRKDILDSIRNGKVYADFLIVNIHTHQTSTYKALGWGGIDHEAPDFLVTLAHESIDNGADMFIAHGVHALRGVEIYKGKPIFYGLSSFVFQFGLLMGASSEVLTNVKGMSQLENPAIHESVLATTRFENGQLMEVRLYPADLGGSRRPISQTGLPVTPSAEEAQRILKELQEFSRPFATTIAIEDNVGVIRVGTMTQSAVTKK